MGVSVCKSFMFVFLLLARYEALYTSLSSLTAACAKTSTQALEPLTEGELAEVARQLFSKLAGASVSMPGVAQALNAVQVRHCVMLLVSTGVAFPCSSRFTCVARL